MVKRYDVVKAGCQAIFEWMCMFSHFSTTEVNNVDRIMQSAYLCVILYVKHKILPLPCSLSLISNSCQNPRWWPRWQLLLVTSQAFSCASSHKIYLMLLKRSKAFHWRQNRFEILQFIKTSRKAFISPLPLVPRWGYEFTCTSVCWLSRDIAPQSCVNLLRRFHGEGKFVPAWISGKLPTYPSPKSTLTLTSHLGQNVGLGEG